MPRRYTMSKKGFDSPGTATGGRKKVVLMNNPEKSLVVALCLSVFYPGLAFSQPAAPAAPAQSATDTKSAEKAAAYYNFAMGHLYSELAGAFGNRSDYTNKAIDHYRQAMKLDPSASFLSEELTDLYIQAGRIKDAVTEAEDLLKQNPNNLDARRLLGRIYARLIGDPAAEQGQRGHAAAGHRAVPEGHRAGSERPGKLADAGAARARKPRLG